MVGREEHGGGGQEKGICGSHRAGQGEVLRKGRKNGSSGGRVWGRERYGRGRRRSFGGGIGVEAGGEACGETGEG